MAGVPHSSSTRGRCRPDGSSGPSPSRAPVPADAVPGAPARGLIHSVAVHARTLLTALALAAVVPAAASAAPAISQGAVRMGADALWSQGARGAGETVAIVDEGFGGLDRSIELGELPSRDQMTLVSFDEENGLDGRGRLGGPIQHGTRMAEIVHDIVPGARLVLVNYGDVPEFQQAAEWVAANGIPIVSHSNSFLVPPYDGTGPAAQAVEAASARGVLWVNSAGNYAERHWSGTADATGAVLALTPSRTGPQPIDLSLSWNDPAVTAELTLEERTAEGDWRTVAEGERRPTRVRLQAFPGDVELRVRIRRTDGPETEFELFSESLGFGTAAVAAGSIPTPGDAPSALVVGAVPWTGDARAAYSSVGPTADGRAKPDVVGPTYVVSNPEWPGTAGTSAATAHVAAAAALLRSRWRVLGLAPTGPALRARLTASALDLGAPGPDLEYGAGMPRLDTSAPLVRTGMRRRHGVTSVRAWATDQGSLRRLEVRVDGRTLRRASAARTEVRLPALGPGRHRIEVEAEDMSRNVGRRVRWVRGPR